VKIVRLTKKQIAVRVILLTVLLLGGYLLLCVRACPTWKPAEVTLKIEQERENPYIDPSGMTQETRILPPEGYTRTEAADGSFLSFMRQQPVYENGSMIYVYDGRYASNANAAAVYAMTVGTEGYQQCADSIIRMWSEYFYSTGQIDRIAFHLSNGDLCDYESWRSGKRVLAIGGLSWQMKLKGYDDSEQQFHNYLVTVMRYAGTLSLEAESQPIAAADAHAGDLFCHGGTPGHAVLIVDEAVNEAGERCFLLAQGMIPAQSFHILTGYGDAQSPWYTQEQLSEETVRLAGYTFSGDALRRWNGGFDS